MTAVGPRRKAGGTVDRIVKALLDRINSGTVGPGEQLRQEDLAKEFGVSRVPVREALQALLEQRVLSHEKHRGFFVAKRTPGEIAQFRRMLHLIEDEVLRTIEWPSPETLEHLRSLNDKMLAVADDHDAAETLALNYEFHFTIFRLSPNGIIVDELARLWQLAQSQIAVRMIAPESRRLRVAEHADIIDRISSQDREGTIEALRRHREAPPYGHTVHSRRSAER